VNDPSELRDRCVSADFPLYGLDGAWSGRRWLSTVCTGPDSVVDYISLGHGDEPNRRPDDPSPRRFVTVVTVPQRPQRKSPDGAIVEATSRTGAASIAGVGLLADSWPWQLNRDLRGDWLRQQTEIAWELADALDGEDWTLMPIPVDGVPAPLRFRESEYGWVIAGEGPGVFLGAYGRGISPYGLGLERVEELVTYEDPAGNGLIAAP
jgi:hypothetical protein